MRVLKWITTRVAKREPSTKVPVRAIFHVGVGGEEEVVLRRRDGIRIEMKGCRKVKIEGIRSGKEKKAMNAER